MKYDDSTELATDDIGRQPSIYVVIALLLLCATLVASRLAPAGDSVIEVNAVLNATTSVTYRFDPRQWRSACPTIAADVEDQIRRGCANCQTTAARCGLGSRQTREADKEQRPSRTLYFEGGRSTFLAESAASGEFACEAGQRAIRPADNTRPFCASTQLARLTDETHLQSSSAIFLVGGIILFLTAAVVAMSYFQRRSMGELEKLTTGHRQATSIVTFLTDTQALFLCWLSLSLGAGSELTLSLQNTFTNPPRRPHYLGWLHFGVDHYRSRLTLHSELSHTFKAAITIGMAHTATAAIGGKISATAPMVFWTRFPSLSQH